MAFNWTVVIAHSNELWRIGELESWRVGEFNHEKKERIVWKIFKSEYFIFKGQIPI